MNGTLANYTRHALLAAAVVVLCWGFGSAGWGGVVASVYFWAKEIGEKSKDWDAPRRPWSDMNPLDSRWSKDNRLDLLSALVGAWAAVIVLA